MAPTSGNPIDSVAMCQFAWRDLVSPSQPEPMQRPYHAHHCEYPDNHWQLLHQCSCGAVTVDWKEAS